MLEPSSFKNIVLLAERIQQSLPVDTIIKAINYISSSFQIIDDFHILPGIGWTLYDVISYIENFLEKKAKIQVNKKRDFDVEKFIGNPEKIKKTQRLGPRIHLVATGSSLLLITPHRGFLLFRTRVVDLFPPEPPAPAPLETREPPALYHPAGPLRVDVPVLGDLLDCPGGGAHQPPHLLSSARRLAMVVQETTWIRGSTGQHSLFAQHLRHNRVRLGETLRPGVGAGLGDPSPAQVGGCFARLL